MYLVTYTKDDEAKKFFSQVKDSMSKSYKHVEVVDVYLDIWDLYECIKKFREIIRDEKGNRVYINVSTGTKITAIAGMMSCMLWNATPYYAHVMYVQGKDEDKKEKEDKDETMKLPSEFITKLNELPVYEIEKPKVDSIRILCLLQENDGVMRKSKIIKELVDMKILREIGDDGNELSGPAKHSQLRVLLDPMESKWNFVEVRASGRRSEVMITEQGKNALKIFDGGYAK